MSKKWKAALAGLAFVAGCEIGIGIQVLKMVRKYTIKDLAARKETPKEDIPSDIEVNEQEAVIPEEEDPTEAAEDPAENPEEDPADDQKGEDNEQA